MAYLAFVMLLGGGARPDIQSLVFLRPVAVLLCGYALLGLSRRHIRGHVFLFGFALALFVLAIAHLIPLPAAAWSALGGREIVMEIDAAAGWEGIWRPISLIPTGTWNAFFALFVPLAALLLGVQLDRSDRDALLPALILLGLASGALGLLQVIGSPQSPLYLYRVTNNGMAVGFFSNRNHQAIFLACLFPMLAVYSSKRLQTGEQARLRLWMAVSAGLVLVPLLLVTGSRSGMLVGLLGLISVAALYRPRRDMQTTSRRQRSMPLAALAIGSAVTILGILTVALGRAEAWRRLMSPDTLEDARFVVWKPISDMAWQYFPFGSGIGTFEEVYKIGEPDQLISLTYLNHAHNDWLEIFMTAGAPGLLLLAAATLAWIVSSWRAWRAGTDEPALFARLGSVGWLILGLASIGDYPLRVPFIGCFAVILALWLVGNRDRAERRDRLESGGSSNQGSIDRPRALED